MADNAYDAGSRIRRWIIAVVAGVAAILLVALQAELVDRAGSFLGAKGLVDVLRAAVILLAGIFGIVAIREGLAGAFAGVHKRQGVVTWRNLLAWALYVLLVVALMEAAGVKANTLLFGGAVATIVLATLAQASLSNVFAGLVMMLARPYRVGEQVYLRSGEFGGAEYEGIVVDIGAFYTILSSRGELLKLPNTTVIRSVLMTRYRPRRAEVELELRADSRLDGVEDEIRNRLGLRPGTRIRLEPIAYSNVDDVASVKVKLQVFAVEPIDTKALIAAIDEAIRSERPEVRRAAVR